MDQYQLKADSKKVRGVSLTSLALYLSMLVVGALYQGEHCKLEVSNIYIPYFLIYSPPLSSF